MTYDLKQSKFHFDTEKSRIAFSVYNISHFVICTAVSYILLSSKCLLSSERQHSQKELSNFPYTSATFQFLALSAFLMFYVQSKTVEDSSSLGLVEVQTTYIFYWVFSLKRRFLGLKKFFEKVLLELPLSNLITEAFL